MYSSKRGDSVGRGWNTRNIELEKYGNSDESTQGEYTVPWNAIVDGNRTGYSAAFCSI